MRGMLRISAYAAYAALVLSSALSACSKSRSPSVGGETNWLVYCGSDDPCETGSCLCGVCTLACEDDESCHGDFAGACTDTDDGAGAQLCRWRARPPAPAVCLPRCSSDDACGGDYVCERGVCTLAPPGGGIALPDAGRLDGGTSIIGGPGAGSGSTTRPPPDGGPPDGGPPDGGPQESGPPDACPQGPDGGCAPLTAIRPLLDQVTLSRAVWDSLVVDGGDTYWYEEQNCVGNVAGGGDATVVQVEEGVAQIAETHHVDACVAGVNRYESQHGSYTMDELYELCADLVMSRGYAVTLRSDDQGVIASCYVTEAPGCFDACGSGFALSGWGFGRPGQDAGGP